MTTLRGTYTALVTPFRDDAARSIDWDAYERLIEQQIAGGVEGLVPAGTTGESPAFSEAEHLELLKKTVQYAKGRVQVVAGTGSNSTAHSVHLSRAAAELGVDAVMAVVPYYNKPSQEGLFQHFAAVAAAMPLPVVVYNIPGRSAQDLAADTLLRLLDAAPNVVATKEATGNVLRAQELLRRAGSRITVLSGDDALTLPMIAVGAAGVISVTSNVLPAEVSAATRLTLSGDFAAALVAHRRLLPLHELMFVEPNPGPVKAALALEGLGNGLVRLPMVPAADALRDRLATAVQAARRNEAG